jgi:peptidyl-prolyl cis-trans isomerase D
MLGTLRRNKNNPIITFVLGLVVLLMMAFGISVQGVQSDGYAAKVNGEAIPETEFNALYAQVYRNKQYQNRRYDRAEAEKEGLRQNVLTQMIASKVLAQKAAAMGLAVNDEALREALQKNERFQADGAFDRAEYERFVNYSGLSEHAFEQAERERLMAQPFSSLVDSMGVSEKEIRETFDWENTKVDVDFIQLTKESFKDAVTTVSEADVAKFKAGEDAEKKIQDYYTRFKSKKYDVPKKVCAQHILVRADDSLPPDILAEKKKAIEKAAQAVAGGMDFTAAAKKFSEDANKDRGGDLGCFGEGETQPQLAQAAFALEPGKVSSIVKTPFGFHIVKVSEIKEPIRKKLEDVQDEIAQELAKETAASSLAKAKAEELARLAKEKANLQEVVDAVKDTIGVEIKVQDTGPFPQGREFLPKLGLAKDVATAAWTLTEAAPVAGPIESDRAWVVIRLKGKEQPKPEEFESAKLGIAYRLISAKQSALRDKWFEMLQKTGEVLIDPIAIRYDEEAENIRTQRRNRSR